MSSLHPSDLQDIEVRLFVQAMQLRYGYDFSGYSPASFKRRVRSATEHFGLATISQLTDRLLHDETLLTRLIARLSVPVTEMFRNPEVFRQLREDVLPWLSSFPRFNVWQAGCASGEEVYSLAILLEEAGLYDRALIYATDFNEHALDRAREGIYAARDARLFSENYQRAGGGGSLSDYYVAGYDHIKLDAGLKRNISFANHNLAADGVFCEAHLILCRNVLIYFSDSLKDRVLRLFRDSLARGGYLCLGNKESLIFSALADEFKPVSSGHACYRLRSTNAV